MLYVTLAPFLAVGAVALGQCWRESFWRLMGLGAVFGAVPVALTVHMGYPGRAAPDVTSR